MFIHVNGVRLFYEKQGTGKPLILLHGNEEDHRIFDEAIELLKKHYTVYAVDSREHGQSDKVLEYHYLDMAKDIQEMIEQLELKDVSLMGSSDGAIIGLLIGSLYPKLVDHLILAGVNVKPNGVILEIYQEMKEQYQKTKNPLIRMMLEEPHISNQQLHQIEAKTLLLAGSDDLIKLDHIERISHHIKNCEFRILEGEDHSSYIIHNKKIAKIILEELK